jgi:hypothetical protein
LEKVDNTALSIARLSIKPSAVFFLHFNRYHVDFCGIQPISQFRYERLSKAFLRLFETEFLYSMLSYQ